jgi:RNA polymerase sigma-70 factor, ECF subfamily
METDLPIDLNPHWRRLMTLLGPIHDQVRLLARQLARSRFDGDDLFQEAVLRAQAKLHTLSDETRFRGWFYAVLLSVHRTRSRRPFWKRFLSLDRERDDGFDPPGEDGEQAAQERMRAERASRALATIPAVQREAVVLFELNGFSIQEIAEMQKVSVSAVKSRLQRGRARLRRHYERLGLGPVQRLVEGSVQDATASFPEPVDAAGAVNRTP